VLTLQYLEKVFVYEFFTLFLRLCSVATAFIYMFRSCMTYSTS